SSEIRFTYSQKICERHTLVFESQAQNRVHVETALIHYALLPCYRYGGATFWEILGWKRMNVEEIAHPMMVGRGCALIRRLMKGRTIQMKDMCAVDGRTSHAKRSFRWSDKRSVGNPIKADRKLYRKIN